MKKQGITILIHTTSSCNLDCGYCYCQENKGISNNITFEVFRTCIAKIDDFLEPHYEICIIFHGGEPLLLGVEFYKQAFRFLKSGLKHKYSTGIQTNLTLLNEQFTQVFQENNCGIGTSLDGNKFSHNSYRKYSNGKGTYEKVIEKMRILQESKIEYGIVSVINEYNILDPVGYYSFLKEYPNARFRLNPMFIVKTNKAYAVNPEAFGNFLIRLYDLWMLDKQPPKITSFEDIINNFIGKKHSSVCTFLADCSKSFYTLDSVGNVYPCCHFVRNPEFRYGNLLDSPFSKIITSDVRSHISQRTDQTQKLCHACEFYELCFSGCMVNTTNGIYNKDYFCYAYKMIFKHIGQSLEKFLIRLKGPASLRVLMSKQHQPPITAISASNANHRSDEGTV